MPDALNLELLQDQQLQQLIRRLVPHNRFWSRRLDQAGIDAQAFRGRSDLARLPLLTKQELLADQLAEPPYGSNLSVPRDRFSRCHQTSGTTTGHPLRWLDTPDNWRWMLDCWRQLYELMELRPDDRLCFPFSFGPFLGFWAGFEGANQLGNFCLAAGGLSSEARLKLILEHQITWLGCTPTYALRLAEVAQNLGLDLAGSAVRAILVAGEPGGGVPETRQRIETAWGARVFDHWGMTEVGPLATEAADSPGNLVMLESACVAEVIDPTTGAAVNDGQMGELVITNLGRIDSPVLRYRTHDLVIPRRVEQGDRTRLELVGGILGRSDDMIIIRGNNLFPAGVDAAIREFPDVAEYRVHLGTSREMQQLRLELEPVARLTAEELAVLAEQIQARFKARFSFYPELEWVSPGQLPRFEMKAARWIRH